MTTRLKKHCSVSTPLYVESDDGVHAVEIYDGRGHKVATAENKDVAETIAVAVNLHQPLAYQLEQTTSLLELALDWLEENAPLPWELGGGPNGEPGFVLEDSRALLARALTVLAKTR